MPWLLTGCEDDIRLPPFLAYRNCCLATALLLLCNVQVFAPAALGIQWELEKMGTSTCLSPRDEILLSARVLWVATVLVNRLRASLLSCSAG